MCACDWDYTCSRCVGTPLDDRYPDLPDPRSEDERARWAENVAKGEARDDG